MNSLHAATPVYTARSLETGRAGADRGTLCSF